MGKKKTNHEDDKMIYYSLRKGQYDILGAFLDTLPNRYLNDMLCHIVDHYLYDDPTVNQEKLKEFLLRYRDDLRKILHTKKT
jgi:hypothetical protein